MRFTLQLFILLTLTLTSCFTGADTYEKSINDYFFLYSSTYKTDNVCLGTINNNYRIGDSYEYSIEKAGWDESFLIFQTKQDKYFIQDLRNLKGIYPKEFRKYLYGPFSKEQFDKRRDSLNVDRELEFSLEY